MSYKLSDEYILLKRMEADYENMLMEMISRNRKIGKKWKLHKNNMLYYIENYKSYYEED